MVDTRDSKSRAKQRGGSRSWNWNKFGSGSRNLSDLLYLISFHPGKAIFFSTMSLSFDPIVFR